MADVNPKAPLVQFPFSAGIDESSRAEVVEAGSGWLVLENGRQDQRGGYSTRPGFAALSTARLDGTSASAGYKLFSDARAPVRIGDLGQVETWSPRANVWQQLGRVCEVDYRTIEIAQFSTGATSAFAAGATVEDIEYCNGYLAVVTQGATAAAIQVLDATTFAPATVSGTIGASTIRPLVASYGGRYFAFLIAGATRLDLYWVDTLNAASLQTATAIPATVTPTTTTYANKAIAICSLTDRIAIAWINNSGGTDRVSVQTYNAAGLIDSVTVNTSSVTPAGVDLGCYQGTGTLWVAWNETTAIKMKGLTYNSLATVLATTATIMTVSSGAEVIGISPSSAAAGRLISNDGVAVDTRIHMRGYQTSAGAAATSGSQYTTYGVNHCSRPFYFNGRHYVQVFGGGSDYPVDAGNTQHNLLLVDWSENAEIVRPVVNLTPGLAVNAFYGKCKTVVGPTSTTLYGVAGVTRSGQSNACTIVEYDFASPKRWQAVAYGNSMYLSGGVLSAFDGRRCTEVGFMYSPPAPLFSAVGGVGTINGTYRWICAYEDIDADGNWSISGISSPSAVQTIANKVSVSMTATPLSITQRVQNTSVASSATTARIAWYRTLAGAVAPYYRVGTSVNNPAAATVTFIDTMLDTALATKAKLYEQPGVNGTVQDHRTPPGLGLLVSYNGMLVGASGSDVWHSAQNIAGEGAWYNPIWQVPVSGAGDITALAVLDGTLFVFKQREVYAINGEAPSDTGAQGGLGLPRRLACDVGAICPHVCTTAYGIVFQSDRGVEILTRSQTVEWLGEGVQVTAAAFPIVTSITVNPVSNTLYIETAASSSAGLVAGGGRTLVYDLSLRTWVSTDRRNSSVSVADTASQSACMIYTGSAWRYAWLSATGVVHVESADHCLDADGSFVAKRAVSANMKSNGLQGKQYVNRVLMLSKRVTAHDFTMDVAYDYSSSYINARTWTNAELAAFAIPNQQLEHALGDDAEGEAIRVQLLDVTPSSGTLGTGHGATWIGLCFEVVPRVGAFQLPDASR